jgi:hypothetical protein
MTARGYDVVSASDGRRYRRYVRWAEIPPAARLPEQLWRWRWRLDDRCLVAIPDSTISHALLFQPCRNTRVEGTELCSRHAEEEQRPIISGRRFGRYGG